MGKLSLRHARLDPSVSVSLVKDEESGHLNWRYRYVVISKNGTYRKHEMKDYEYGEFRDFDEFKSRIEFERYQAKADKDNL
jgi:hypothetical protein|tara:strand:- start:7785 stop:8027 length:243 start_codon:yes stop_codon:yes gene_type:complete